MKRREENLLGWLSFGAFLVIIGIVFFINMDLVDEIEVFIRDFKLKQVSGHFYLPTPQKNHPTLYQSIAIFCFAYGAYQFLLLILKFALGAEPAKKSETLKSAILWPVIGFLMLMLKNGTIVWFTFIATLVVLAAIAIIMKSVTYIIFRKHNLG